MDRIEVRCAAPVGPVAFFPGKIPLGGQLVQSAFHRGAGEFEVGDDSVYLRQEFTLGV